MTIASLALRRCPQLLAGALVLALTACGGVTSPQRVDYAQSLTGAVTATVDDATVHAIADDPQPAIPATVTDVQGTEVVVDDISRILALDLYGTTSRIVFELGLGANVVGRDSSWRPSASAPTARPSGPPPARRPTTAPSSRAAPAPSISSPAPPPSPGPAPSRAPSTAA
ncbi:hypothetical protein [Tessaracoccus lacteus]|uniref:hypothetical protein n=1 Tax=Tessaracoccus lacteus TaxID=3041766 RepID=UPI003F68EEBC